MGEPSNLLLKLSRRLFAEARDRDAFVEALVNPQPFPTAIVWMQPRLEVVPFAIAPALPWQPAWVDRLSGDQRPGQHGLHQDGAYYCLDMASVFSAAVLSAIATPTESVLDLCAAPGGKSLLAWKALTPDHLWCNEVVRKRVRVLIANLKRCGLTDSLVFNLDPQTFAEQLPHAASVVIVDAPCSGQSLLAKGDQALGCFHPVNIKKNASRQKRILASAAQTVTGGGYLAYMTCTFSPDENEQVVEWLIKKFPQFEAVEVPVLADYASPLSALPCYRLWPQSGLGAGGFTALLHNRATSTEPINLDFLAAQGMQIYGVERSP
ncbi:RsmB/NOP family class I SAM-dependent RNA methyltransferase [Phormidium tenue]|uniref:Fmu (Sun) domain-containing protein n=1 Tax=Phormidium tenue NIES-30 TaxID=549789 RepID=A0A1U7J0R0_9CYAN|nr:RsmB/NOP family class I SAM-dependent RNA methyltransferase [Phormidium tenue]MBD2234243.1 RsmB/NOP family class I SAM-dependent RNA methyltransferase [Phormidium tenue FACHB-1052]OKH45177.1 Fmu (Sun) domain-containing protein [Phormidium tenue NIES-30]